MQPISEETQLLLTVYYLVQLGEPGSSCGPGMDLTGGGGDTQLDPEARGDYEDWVSPDLPREGPVHRRRV